MTIEQEYLTQRETAALLHISRETLAAWRRAGTPKLEYVQLSTRTIRYPKDAVERFKASQANAPE